MKTEVVMNIDCMQWQDDQTIQGKMRSEKQQTTTAGEELSFESLSFVQNKTST